jgi:SAM-dependent methyltransferase
MIEQLPDCPLCGSVDLKALSSPGCWIGEEVFGPYRKQLGLNRCRQCSLCFVNPRPAEPLLSEFYNGDTYCCHTPDTSASAWKKSDFILSLLAERVGTERRRLLDFGAGGGVFLRRAADLGWDAEGFEIGRRGLQTCRDHGLKVSDRLADFSPGSFAVITLNHVFEHLSNHAEVLSSLRGLLAPTGRLFIEVPNVSSLRAHMSLPSLSRHLHFDERYRAYPIHLFYFNKSTVTRLLTGSGYRVEEIFTVGMGVEELIKRGGDAEPRASDPTVATTLATPQGSAAKRLAKSIVKKMILGPGLGENLCVICRPN